MRTKKCSKCKKTKSTNKFHRNNKAKDGLFSRCKECRKPENKKYRKLNVKKIVAYNKEWRERTGFVYKLREKRKTDLGIFFVSMYAHIRKRINGHTGGKYHQQYIGLPHCTKEEFVKLASSSRRLKALYKNWQNSGFEYKLTPTTDRIDSSKGYVLNNMQFLTLSENSRKKRR